MSVSLLLEMAASGNPDRIAIVSGDLRLTTQQLSDLADGGAGVIAASGAQHVVYVGTGGAMLPLLIFASARAGLAFTPINYRLSADGIQALIDRLPLRQRQIMALTYDGATPSEIAEIFGSTPEAVRSRLHKARITLRHSQRGGQAT